MERVANLRRAVAIKADLIVAPCRARHRLPGLLGYTDWELLRLSPVPVLLVKTATPYRRPKMLAAIDPTHTHAKSSALDPRILDYGAQVGRALRGSLGVVHAYLPRSLPPTATFDTKRRKSLLADGEREARKTSFTAGRSCRRNSRDCNQNGQRDRRYGVGVAICIKAIFYWQHS